MPVKLEAGWLMERMRDCGLPEHMHEGLLAYILVGRPVGHFLTAVLSNDLAEAVNRGDEKNQAALPNYIKFLNYAPIGCWHSEAHVEQWMTQGGARGLTQAD